MSTIPYIRLRSGRKFHFLNPAASEIDIKDVAWALSHICRFTGHVKEFYSVAQHCCHVCDILPDEFKLHGLLHDTQEFACQDIANPIKQFLPQYKEFELKIEKVVAKKFGLAFPMPATVKTADMVLLVTEMRDLMRGGDYKNIPFSPMGKKIKPWSAQKARREFLKRFKQLT